MSPPQPIGPERLKTLLELNNTFAEELSHLDMQAFTRMSQTACFARCIENEAFLLAFDQTADYQSVNFLWFVNRYDRFVYVDRIVVAPHARGRGLATVLYEELFQFCARSRHDRVVCEVNIRPPNPLSDAFHERLGFREVGSGDIREGTKTVRYIERLIRA